MAPLKYKPFQTQFATGSDRKNAKERCARISLHNSGRIVGGWPYSNRTSNHWQTVGVSSNHAVAAIICGLKRVNSRLKVDSVFTVQFVGGVNGCYKASHVAGLAEKMSGVSNRYQILYEH